MTPVATLTLSRLSGTFAVVQGPQGAAVPDWAMQGELWAVMGAPGELSLVTGEHHLPQPLTPHLKAEGGWVALKLHGPFPFDLTGILTAVLLPLRDAGVGIFALSTFDTDYVLVKDIAWDAALRALRQAGHTVEDHWTTQG